MNNLKDYDFTERLNRDRAIEDGLMQDPRLEATEEEVEAGEEQLEDAVVEVEVEDTMVEEDLAEDSAPQGPIAKPPQKGWLDVRNEAEITGFAEETDPYTHEQQKKYWSGAALSSSNEAPVPRMVRLRSWLMSAVRGLVWMFLTMWTLDRLDLFQVALSRFDVSQSAAQLYATGAALIILASLFLYLVKAFRTATHPEMWRTTASGLVLGGVIGAFNGIGPSTYFLALVAEYGNII